MMKKYRIIYLLVLCGIMLCSCGKKDLPDEDFIDFARDIEKQMRNGDDISIVNAFDYDEFEKRVLANVDIPKKEKNRASDFIKENINPAMSILEMVMNSADFRFIKFYRKGNEPHVIFRIYFNGGVSLEDWVLGVKDGQILIYDAFAIVSGISWSEDCRQKLCNHLGIFTEEILTINKLIDANYLIANGEYSAADSMLYWIMPQMQENLYARTMELNLSSMSKSYEDMIKLTDDFEKTFPQEKRICVFYLMQSSIQHGLADETSEQIYTLIKLIGDDPIYYVYQAWAFQQANANNYALQMLDSAIHYIPHVFDLYLNKLDVYYFADNYRAFVDMLYQIDTLFSPEDEDVTFFRENYELLNRYEPFNKWVQSKEDTNKLVNK